MPVLSVLVAVIVFGLFYWAVHRIAGACGLPAPIVAVLDVLIVVVAVWYLLGLFGVVAPVRLR